MSQGQRPIVIKRIKKHSPNHGGQWKIAYADFVTAMMAFFLLMWLLGSATQAELQGISKYFQTPLDVAPDKSAGNGDRISLIQAGGKDLTRLDGQMRKSDADTDRPRNLRAERAEWERRDTLRLDDLKRRLERLIESNATMREFRSQLLLDITTEGLRIQIIDDKNRPMFALARAELEPHTREILQRLGGVLNEMPNRVSLSGHTDATAYASGEKNYSNWELSADRANASRRELIMGGMDEQKILRVVGLGSAVLFDKNDPTNPVNRRISVIVMSNRAAEALSNEGSETKEIKTNAVVDLQTLQSAGAS
ncbi:MAG: flagellar motor protein MotB [Nitrosospira sp.]|nr:flagellar motor protein MotB [Nitrosospira sp.]